MSRHTLGLWLSFILLWPASGILAEVDELAAPAFPDVSQVVPASAALELELEELRAGILREGETEQLREALTASETNVDALNTQISPKDPLESWSASRLADLEVELKKNLNILKKPLETLTTRLQELATEQQTWAGKEVYWAQWRKQLLDQPTGTSTEALDRADRSIREALKALKSTIAKVSEVQQKASALQVQINLWKSQIDVVQTDRRKGLFTRNELPMTNVRYLRQLTPDLLKEAYGNILETLSFRPEFWKKQGWLIGVQLLVVLWVGRVIYRHRTSPTSDDWQFFMRHPWATGTFLGFLAFVPVYQTPSPLFAHAMGAVIVVSGCLLASSLLQDRLKTLAVALVTGTGILTASLQILAFPPPLYRVYIVLIGLIGIPTTLWMAYRYRHRPEVLRPGSFYLLLRLGSLLFAISLGAQLVGYTLLSNRLLQSGVQTFILIMVTVMLFRLLRGGMVALVRRLRHKGVRFFQNYGEEFQGKLLFLVKILLTFTALAALLPIWEISGPGQKAISTLLDYGISSDDFRLTLGMVLTAIGVFYIAMFFSWILQGALDVAVTKTQYVDQGLRDSMKRLLHYLIVFTGFLVAMNLVGIEIRHFAVIAGALGIGIGFGLQNIVNNFISGLILLFERPVKVGDMILLDGDYGTIRKIGLRSTIVATLDQAEVIVPNSMMVSEKVINWTLSTPMARVRLPVGVAYGSDVSLVLEKLLEAAQHPRVLDHPSPSALFTGFGDSSLDFELQFWIASAHDRLRIRSEVGQSVDQRFREVGIEIPFPQRDLHLRSSDIGNLDPGNSSG